MALFPIYGRFVGDCIPHLVAVDTGDTMAQVAEKIAVHSVGRRIRPRPGGHGYEVLVGGHRVDGDAVLGSLGLHPLDWVDVRFAEGPE
ncbi:MAG TPA: toluene-4-monooxygenase system B family protein [Kofleriaceae bacterium]